MKHVLRTLLALISLAVLGVFGVWLSHALDIKDSNSNLVGKPKEPESVTSVVNSIINRLSK